MKLNLYSYDNIYNRRYILIYFLLLVLLFFTSSLLGQNILWTNTFGSTGDDGAESILMTAEGDVVLTGFKSSGNVEDVLLMKTDSSGNEIWSKTYNLHLTDWARCVKQTTDGGYVIAGMTEVSPQVFDPFLIKTDALGNLLWQKQYDYGFGDDDRAHSVWPTNDGGYLIAGQTWLMHGAFGNYDMYIIKTDGSGNVQWQKIFYRENEGADVALSVQQLSDDGYIIGGFTQSSAWASYILRLDVSGNVIWSNIYPGAWQSECYEIQSTPDGGFIFTGTESSFTTDTDLLITKLNSDGSLAWKKIYGTVDAEQGESIQQLTDGFVIAGMSSHGAGGYDMYVVRTDLNGEFLWNKTIGGNGDDRAFGIIDGMSGTYILTGWTWSFGLGLGDVYLVKISDSVVPVELTSFSANVSGNDVLLNWITATELNNQGFEIERMAASLQNSQWEKIGFVAGTGTTTGPGRYSFTDENLPAGIYLYRLKQIDFNGSFEYSENISAEIINAPAQFILNQNYPNPFNPSTRISFKIGSPVFVSLNVYDLLGNEIATLVNEQRSSGSYEIEFNASSLVGGVYFYKLTAGNFTETKKLVLLK